MAQILEMPEKFLHFDGLCPFLLCLERASHDHPVCRACGTVNHSNYSGCETCRKKRVTYVKGLLEERRTTVQR